MSLVFLSHPMMNVFIGRFSPQSDREGWKYPLVLLVSSTETGLPLDKYRHHFLLDGRWEVIVKGRRRRWGHYGSTGGMCAGPSLEFDFGSTSEPR